MEPTSNSKPRPAVFLLMTAIYFAAYFGLKYGVFGGALPWYYNLALILVCLGIALGTKGWMTER